MPDSTSKKEYHDCTDCRFAEFVPAMHGGEGMPPEPAYYRCLHPLRIIGDINWDVDQLGERQASANPWNCELPQDEQYQPEDEIDF